MKIKYKIKSYKFEHLLNTKVHLVHPSKEFTQCLVNFLQKNQIHLDGGLTLDEIIKYWDKNVIYTIDIPNENGAWYCLSEVEQPDHLKDQGCWSGYVFLKEKDFDHEDKI